MNYDNISAFESGVAIVQKDGYYGAILMGGHEIIEPKYNYLSSFKNGFAEAIKDAECYIINLSGHKCVKFENTFVEVPQIYDTVRDYNEGMAAVCLNNKWGFIDINGNEMVPLHYDEVTDYYNGFACCSKFILDINDSKTNRVCIFDKNGNCIVNDLTSASIDSEGNIVGQNKYGEVRYSAQGKIMINCNGHFKTLNKKYEYVSPQKNEGIHLAKINNKWGCIDENETHKIPFIFDFIYDFKDGTVLGLYNNKKVLSYDNTMNDIPSIDGNVSIFDANNKIILVEQNKSFGLYFANIKVFTGVFFTKCKITRPKVIEVHYPNNDKHYISTNGSYIYTKDNVNKEYPIQENFFWGDMIDDCTYTCLNKEKKYGALNNKSEIIIPFEYSNIEIVDKFIIVEKTYFDKKQYGVYSKNGKLIIPVECECVEYCNYFFKVKKHYRLYIYNLCGKVLDEAHFENATYFGFKTIIVSSNNKKYGLIDLDGNTILNCTFSQIKILNESKHIFEAHSEDQHIIANSNGQTILVKNNGNYVVLPSFFNYAKEIDNSDIAIAELKDKSGFFYINSKLEFVLQNKLGKWNTIPNNWEFSKTLCNGKYIVFERDFNKGVADSDMNIVIPCIYNDIDFDNNTFICKTQSPNVYYRLIDMSFRIVAEIPNKPYPIGTSYFKTGKSNTPTNTYTFGSNKNEVIISHWGIIDNFGKQILPEKYARIEMFTEHIGHADEQIIDKYMQPIEGMFIAKVDFYTLPFLENKIIVEYNGVKGVLFGDGTFIEYSHLQTGFHLISDYIHNFAIVSLWDITNKQSPKLYSVYEKDKGLLYDFSYDSSYNKIDNQPVILPIGNKKCAILHGSNRSSLDLFNDNNNRILSLNHFIIKDSYIITCDHVYNTDGDLIFSGNYNEIQYDNNVFLVKNLSNRWGFTDLEGNVICEPQYEKLTHFEGDVAFFKLKGSSNYCWGAIKKNGNVLDLNISKYYNYGYPYFDKGIIEVSRGNRQNCYKGYINTYGNFVSKNINQSDKELFVEIDSVVKNPYTFCSEFNEKGIATIFNKNKMANINIMGEVLSEEFKTEDFIPGSDNIHILYDYNFTEIQNLDNDYCKIKKDDKWGIYRNNDGLIITPQFDNIIALKSSEANYFFITELNNKHSIFDDRGKPYCMHGMDMIKPLFLPDSIYPLYFLIKKDNKFGVIDLAFKIILERKYDWISDIKNDGCLTDDYLIINRGITTGFYDLNTKTIIFPQISHKSNNFGYHEKNEIGYLGKCIYYIKNYGGIELYNKNTKLKIDYEISHIESFKGNYAIFTDRCGLFGVIYKDGKIIFSPIYNHISMIDPLHFEVSISGKSFPQYLDITGRRGIVIDKNFILFDYAYDEIHYIGSGLIAVSTVDRLWGIVTLQNQIVLPIEYKHISDVEGEKIVISKMVYNKYYQKRMSYYGIIDVKGNFIIEPCTPNIILKLSKGLILYSFDYRNWNIWYPNISLPKDHLEGYISIIPLTREINIGKKDILNRYYLLNNKGDIFVDTQGHILSDYGFTNIERKGSFIYLIENFDQRIIVLSLNGDRLMDRNYKEMSDFVDGFSIVKDSQTNHYGIIDTKFKEIKPCCYYSMEYLGKGLFRTECGVLRCDGCLLYKEEPLLLFPQEVVSYKEIGNNRLIVKTKRNKYGLLTTKMDIVLPFIFTEMHCYCKSKIVVFKLDDNWGVANIQGKIIQQNRFKELTPIYHKDNDKNIKNEVEYIKYYHTTIGIQHGLLDEFGNTILPPYYKVLAIGQNVITFLQGKIWGIYDIKKRTFNYYPQYSFLSCECENMITACIGGKENTGKKTLIPQYAMWGFIDKNGNVLIDFKYDFVSKFKKGFSKIKLNGKFGIINKEGKIVVPCKYGCISSFNDKGIAKCYKESKFEGDYTLINTFGQKVGNGSTEIEMDDYDYDEESNWRSDPELNYIMNNGGDWIDY